MICYCGFSHRNTDPKGGANDRHLRPCPPPPQELIKSNLPKKSVCCITKFPLVPAEVFLLFKRFFSRGYITFISNQLRSIGNARVQAGVGGDWRDSNGEIILTRKLMTNEIKNVRDRYDIGHTNQGRCYYFCGKILIPIVQRSNHARIAKMLQNTRK